MTVSELIEHLKTLPQDLPVVRYNGSEEIESLEGEDIQIDEGDDHMGWYCNNRRRYVRERCVSI